MTRKNATIVVVTLCVVLVAAALTLNIGWIYVNARSLLPLVLGVLAFALIIAGIIVYTVFLVRELHRNDQQDAFLNAVTHELKTPIASIRLYLQTLQSRDVSEAQRADFYRIMLADADRLQQTVEQVLKAGAAGQRVGLLHRGPVDMAALVGRGARSGAPASPPHAGDHDDGGERRPTRPSSTATPTNCEACSPTCSTTP